MATDIDDLKTLNDDSIDALNNRAEFLRSKKDGLLLAQRASLLATIADLDNRIRVLEFTREHLVAAQVSVQFDEGGADQTKLNDLAGKLDKDIAADAELNAVLKSIPVVMDAAIQIDTIINGHITQP
jgi:hypothetical protein